MRVLITGATGFVGSHLCRRMVAEGHEVRVLCRPSSDTGAIDGLPIERVVGDVTDYASVEKAVSDRQWVVHAAAHIDTWRRLAAEQTRVNVDGTAHVARACREAGVGRLLHVSSVAAIGIPTSAVAADEDFRFDVDPRLTYHWSKRAAEEVVAAEVAHGLDAVIVNPASIFGPHGRRYRGAEMVAKVRRGPVVPCFGGGICVVHVTDVVAGIVAALHRGSTGQRYILGGENVTFRALAERAARAMRLRRRVVTVPPLVTATAAAVQESWGRLVNRRPRITWATHHCAGRYHFYDSTRARSILGYAPRPFDAILAECLASGV